MAIYDLPSSSNSRTRNTGRNNTRRDDDDDDEEKHEHEEEHHTVDKPKETVEQKKEKSATQKYLYKTTQEKSEPNASSTKDDIVSDTYQKMYNIHTAYSNGEMDQEQYIGLMREGYPRLQHAYDGTNSNAADYLARNFGLDSVTEDFLWHPDWESYLQNNLNWSNKSNTGNPSAPRGKAPRDGDPKWIAYMVYQARQRESDTQAAEQQYEMLRDEVSYLAGRNDLNLSPDEIKARLHWERYPMLTRMDEQASIGSPLSFNRSIGYSRDYIDGMIWAARNDGGSGEDLADTMYYYGGAGKQYERNEEVHEKLNPASEKYSPYSVASTMYDECQYFGVDHFDQGWLDDNRDLMGSPVEEERRMYRDIEEAVKLTEQCQQELNGEDGLYASIEDDLAWMEDLTPEELDEEIDSLISQYPGLKKLDAQMRKGVLASTASPIDFSRNDLKQRIEKRLEEVKQQNDAREESNFLANLFSGFRPQDEKQPTQPTAEKERQGSRWVSEHATRPDDSEAFATVQYQSGGITVTRKFLPLWGSFTLEDGTKTTPEQRQRNRDKKNAVKVLDKYYTPNEKTHFNTTAGIDIERVYDMGLKLATGKVDKETAFNESFKATTAYAGAYYADAANKIDEYEVLQEEQRERIREIVRLQAHPEMDEMIREGVSAVRADWDKMSGEMEQYRQAMENNPPDSD